MEKKIHIHIEKLPEGLYLATSDEIQGLVAQGRTITETIEIARDIVKKLLEEELVHFTDVLPEFEDSFVYPLVVSC